MSLGDVSIWSQTRVGLSLHQSWLLSSGGGIVISAATGVVVATASSVIAAAASGASGAVEAGGATRTIKAGVVARCTSVGWSSSKRTANGSWLTLKSIVALFTAGQASTLLLEVSHTDSRQSGCGVVFRFVLMDLVNGNSSVNY